MPFRTSSLFIAPLLAVGACSDTHSVDGPGQSVAPNAEGGRGGGGSSGENVAPPGAKADAGGADGGSPEPPPEPGLGYLKRSPLGGIEALYYDPAAGKSVSLAAQLSPSDLRRPWRGGRPFAFMRQVSNLPTVFKGYSGKSGAAKAAFTLSPKSASSPQVAVGVDTAGAAYYAGELDQRGFVDFFKDGVRLSQGPGRVAASARLPVSLVDARGGSVAWSVGFSLDEKLMLRWIGQASEEEVESDSARGGGGGGASFSPTGHCFAFPAKIISPTAQIGLGVRCKGEPTRVLASTSGARIGNAQDSVLWHPTLDRLAAMDYVVGNAKYVSIASRAGAAWSLERVALPADAPAAAIALAPSGRDLYVATGLADATRLFAFSFGGAAPTPDQARSIAVGPQVTITMSGFSSADGSLALIRRSSQGSAGDVALVAPDDSVKSIFSTTELIKEARWSPDGQRLAVRVSGGIPPLVPETADLYLVDAAGGNARKLNEPGQLVRAMKWSDTSGHLGFLADADGATGRFYVANPAAGAAPGAPIDSDVTGFLSDPPRAPF